MISSFPWSQKHPVWRRRLLAFWFGRESGHRMAVFRMAFGVYLLVYFGKFFFGVPMLFSSEGVTHPKIIPDIPPPAWLAWLVYGGAMMSSVAILVGFVTRIFVPVALGFFLYHYLLVIHSVIGSFDYLNLILFVTLCFGDADRVWSVTSWFRPAEASARSISIWPARLLMVYVTYLYLGTGMSKGLGLPWQTGNMLHFTFQQSYVVDWLRQWASSHPPFWILTALTWSVVFVEWILIPVGLWTKKLRMIAVIAGVTLHGSIYYTMGISEFFNYTTIYTLFWSSKEYRAIVGRWMPLGAKH